MCGQSITERVEFFSSIENKMDMSKLDTARQLNRLCCDGYQAGERIRDSRGLEEHRRQAGSRLRPSGR